jgi:hypothetical protein
MAVESILGQIMINGFSGLLGNLTSSYVQNKVRSISEPQEVIKRDLKDHLEITFNKCMNIKTILKSDVTAKTLEIYVDQTFRVSDEEFDQYSMIDFIRSGNSAIIIGEGGGGKSMFMRYLWLSYFEKSDGKIPFFLELRNLNTLTHSNISDFIFHSIIKSGSTIPQGEFKAALRAGEFILFLDGFDEINFDKREVVQKMILELQEVNPALTIVVTSRSDERFMGWESFRQAQVCALSKETSKLLIQRANCDEELKAKFLSKFESLYSDHSGFLSNPLLAYMMLVTFSYNPDIPTRMFQFYEQAFEALYHRHDLTKGYKRKFRVKLDKFDFIRLTSYLCLKTYFDEDVEFSRGDLLSAVESVKKIEGVAIDADAFIDDLVQSVCILKMEGLTYTFTHRTFQEYFAAYCIARVASRNIEKIFSTFSNRYSDKVLPMVADINPDLFREKYLIPNAKKFGSFIHRKTDRLLVNSFGNRTGSIFLIRDYLRHERPKIREHRDFGIGYSAKGEMSDFFRVVISVLDRRSVMNRNLEKSDASFVSLARKYSPFGSSDMEIQFQSKSIQFHFIDEKHSHNDEFRRVEANPEVTDLLTEAFKDSEMSYFLEKRATAMLDYVRREIEKHDKVTGAFSDLF